MTLFITTSSYTFLWERLPTPVFWPGEFHVLYSPWGLKESGVTERLSLSLSPPKLSSLSLILFNKSDCKQQGARLRYQEPF